MIPDKRAIFQEAEALLRKDDAKALELYQSIRGADELAALSSFRMGEIFNRLRDPISAYEHHRTAFRNYPNLTKIIVKEDHPSHNYVYQASNLVIVEYCPLCGGEGTPYSCYNATTSLDFIPGFDPVRLWMACDACHHLFAYSYPANLGELLSNTAFEFNLKPKTHLLPVNGRIMAEISRIAPGPRLLEVGVGAGEMAAVAKEFLFDVVGIDIRPAYADAVENMLDVRVHCEDFLEFAEEERYDIVMMGDVIEHLSDPLSALRKAHRLLNDSGLLWISTPNFESAYSLVTKDADPMWRIVEHLNYFSAKSMSKCLTEVGFDLINYQISQHYNGSMEIMAMKR